MHSADAHCLHTLIVFELNIVGGTPRNLPIPGWTLKNVCSLRSLDDATYISEQCVDKNVLICGASFIGMELASAVISKAKSVTVCDVFNVPFEQALGKEVCCCQRFRKDVGNFGIKYLIFLWLHNAQPAYCVVRAGHHLVRH